MGFPGPLQSQSQTNDLPMIIGSDTAGAAPANVEIAELVFFKRAGGLPAYDVQRLIDYFVSKFGL